MNTNPRNRCDEIIALIDRCLAEYEAATSPDLPPSGAEHGSGAIAA